jgi:hypothetical protein
LDVLLLMVSDQAGAIQMLLVALLAAHHKFARICLIE